MAGQVIIELGADWDPEPEREQPLEFGGFLRWLGVVLAVLLGTSAAVSPPGPGLVVVATIEDANARVWVDGRTALTLGGSRAAAYDAATGERRWEIVLPGALTDVPMWSAGTILLVYEQAAESDSSDRRSQVAVVDRETGEWQHVDMTGYPLRVGPTTVLMEARRESPSGAILPGELMIFDVELLARVQTIPPPFSWTLSPDRGTLYALSADATLSEWDTGTWTVRRSTSLALRLLDWASMSVTGQVLSVRTGVTDADGGWPVEASEITSQSVDLATLAPTTVTAASYLSDCGPVWCGYLNDDLEHMILLDRSTGRPLWRVESHGTVVPSPVGMLLVGGQAEEIGPPTVGVVDPFTGRTLADLRGWTLVTGSYWEVRPDQAPYLLRLDRARGGAFLGLVTADGGIDLIGELNFNARQCGSDGPYLVCSDTRHGVHLLRVERAAVTS